MHSMLLDPRKVLLFGKKSTCRIALVKHVLYPQTNAPLPFDLNMRVNCIGEFDVTSVYYGTRKIKLCNIPEVLLNPPSMLRMYFEGASMVLLCMDYIDRASLSEMLRLVRDQFPVGPVSLVFYCQAMLGTEVLSQAENFCAEIYGVSEALFLFEGRMRESISNLKQAILWETIEKPLLPHYRQEYTPGR